MNGSLLDQLSQPACWEAFYTYKKGLACPKSFIRELRGFIDRRGFLPVCETICAGGRFPLPKRSVISKMGVEKKRVVYTYPQDENTVLKLLTWLLLRKYDRLFSDTLYSFRPGRTAKDAVVRLARTPQIRTMYAYKADVRNYFNAAPIELLVNLLEEAVGEDGRLFIFLRALLEEPEVLEAGKPIREEKGMMAGTPLSAFYANLFLRETDAYFEREGIPYVRYSDDIILFAESRDQLERRAAILREKLTARGLRINPDKEQFFAPADGWVFLGFRYQNGVVDLAPASLAKLKGKMRRKTRALARWSKRNGFEGEKAARAFVRIFNRKLFENPADNDLTWTRWFFPVLTTADSLREIDRYAEDCIRYLVSGTRTKARYNVRYDDLKALGFRSLVHAYYEFRKEK